MSNMLKVIIYVGLDYRRIIEVIDETGRVARIEQMRNMRFHCLKCVSNTCKHVDIMYNGNMSVEYRDIKAYGMPDTIYIEDSNYAEDLFNGELKRKIWM